MNTDKEDSFFQDDSENTQNADSENTQNADSKTTDRVKLLNSTIKVFYEQEKKRFDLLCCIYKSEVKGEANISITDFVDNTKDVYLSSFDNIKEVLTALEILKGKGLVYVISPTLEELEKLSPGENLPRGSVSITLAGITEVESQIADVLEIEETN
jgi:hypothetical protein